LSTNEKENIESNMRTNIIVFTFSIERFRLSMVEETVDIEYHH